MSPITPIFTSMWSCWLTQMSLYTCSSWVFVQCCLITEIGTDFCTWPGNYASSIQFSTNWIVFTSLCLEWSAPFSTHSHKPKNSPPQMIRCCNNGTLWYPFLCLADARITSQFLQRWTIFLQSSARIWHLNERACQELHLSATDWLGPDKEVHETNQKMCEGKWKTFQFIAEMPFQRDIPRF